MPPIHQWNPILQRLYEKTRDFDINTDFVIVAEIIGVSKDNMSKWIRGSTMRQDKVEIIARHMIQRGYYTPDEIIYVLTGEGMSESGAYRTINYVNHET